MLEKLNRNLSHLMEKVETAGSLLANNDPSASCSTLGTIRAIEREYEEIHSSAVDKLADLEIVYENLNSSKGDHPERELLAEKFLQNTYDFCFSELARRMASFWLEAGNWFHQSGKLQDALVFWERVLKFDPNNPHIHARVNQLIEETLEDQNRASSSNEEENVLSSVFQSH